MFEKYINFLFNFHQKKKKKNEIKGVYLGIVHDTINEKMSQFTS